ncbi:ribosome maturation factor RimM [Eubacterium sp.]|uniref:ribosome maturation factor RimM n=1 Tax=Eubacterium sp. TaxID=142586 RepID=UPI0025CF80AC|nr:ribosome maturation factor RimM [Eubacterium sp.]MCR5628291.1 ribosome maturation factor RimM [Eubacterium sp.]
MQDYLRVGVLVKPHGVRGEMKVFPTTDDMKRFEDLIEKDVFFDIKGNYEAHKIVSVKYFKQFAILQFEDITDMDMALKLKNIDVYVKREDAVELEEGEYYIADLLGLSVYLEDGSLFGKLKDVMETGANDVYVISTEEHGEVLVPVIDDCVKEVDLENEKIIIHLMEGLI